MVNLAGSFVCVHSGGLFLACFYACTSIVLLPSFPNCPGLVSPKKTLHADKSCLVRKKLICAMCTVPEDK